MIKSKVNIDHIALVAIWLFFMSLNSCDDPNDNISMPDPLSGIVIGDSEEHVANTIEKLRRDKILSEDNEVLINGDHAKVSFIYCRTCFGKELDAVIFNFSKVDTTMLPIKLDNQNTANIKWHVVEDSYDLLPNKPSHYSLCVYSKDIEYDNRLKTLKCKKENDDPCW